MNKHHHIAEGFDNYDGVMADAQESGNLAKGSKTECWYDPGDPEKSVLVRHFHPKFYLGALIPGSFVFFGSLLMRSALRRKPMKALTCVSLGTRLRHQLSPVLSTRGTRVTHKQLLVERHDFQIEANETFAGTFSIPTNAQLSTKTVQTLVTWNIRLRRKLSGTGGYDTDYPFRVEGGRLPGDVD